MPIGFIAIFSLKAFN